MYDFYVYSYLDPRKPGPYYYHNFIFSHQPFYVGKGRMNRWKPACHLYCTNTFLTNKIRKIGEDKIIVMFELTGLSEKDALKFEIFLTYYIGRKDLNKGPLLNLTSGGGGSFGRRLSEETKRKIGLKSSQKKMSGEAKLKIRKAMKGKNVGKMNGMYRISPFNKGKSMSEEQRQKLREVWVRRKARMDKDAN